MKKFIDVSKKLSTLLEELRLADQAHDDLGMGDFYMADTKQELIQGINNLTLGDSIGIIQNNKEITIMLDDEDNYSFIVDNGNKVNNWQLEDNGPVFKNVNKDYILKLIELAVN